MSFQSLPEDFIERQKEFLKK